MITARLCPRTLLSSVTLSIVLMLCYHLFFFFFNDTATTEIYTLSLHDALPIYGTATTVGDVVEVSALRKIFEEILRSADRKSTRLNSSHTVISYAVFCLKKKKNKPPTPLFPHD